ncbi:MAG: replication-associated recombination protein A [Alphaproteobacteria bacterium]|nr:replication-associated recombination protein A [Alphaproteobacteria bacterium]
MAARRGSGAGAGEGAGAASSLFGAVDPPGAPRPLADKLRPATLDQVIGQDHLVGPQGALTRLLAAGHLPSLMLWGPPGTGKTTLARLLAQAVRLELRQVSAVFSGVADLRRVFDEARSLRGAGRGTLLFVDEIHRFNRAQQDGFLPFVEDGSIVLIGATTENPSFALVPALLSRARVLVLRRLDDQALETLLQRAEALHGRALPLDGQARLALRAMADGDGRYLLNMAETLLALGMGAAPLDSAALAELVQKRAPLHDRAQESHYNLISALHKALRGSDTDAALYWLARMLVGGEDPDFIARRLVRFASEDVGLADPQALVQALAAWQAYERLGTPEGELALVQATAYLGTAPKSNALYRAAGEATRAARASGSLMPPLHAVNAPTRLMKELGYGSGYAYDHDDPDGFSGLSYFPPDMARERYYRPVERGFEREIAKRLDYWDKLRRSRSASAMRPADGTTDGTTDGATDGATGRSRGGPGGGAAGSASARPTPGLTDDEE